ncbi:hypothetical protein E2C01_094275 [Portunus trituberculatus]|uniref:Uncharacterized protein n=1 Tax=Portunus trituberculatus TaxID=210409 RepID=A0A5B7JVQ4_PORTR|nr:hypothetical protein [Portunus trituberculatus]
MNHSALPQPHCLSGSGSTGGTGSHTHTHTREHAADIQGRASYRNALPTPRMWPAPTIEVVSGAPPCHPSHHRATTITTGTALINDYSLE